MFWRDSLVAFEHVLLICIQLSAVMVHNGHASCVFFQSNCSSTSVGSPQTTLTFSIDNRCGEKNNPVYFVEVTKTRYFEFDQVICKMEHKTDGSCNSTAIGCTCNSQSPEFSVITHHFIGTTELWKLNGVLWSGQHIQQQLVKMNERTCTFINNDPTTESSRETIRPNFTTEQMYLDGSTTTQMSKTSEKPTHEIMQVSSEQSLTDETTNKPDVGPEDVNSLVASETHNVTLQAVCGCLAFLFIAKAIFLGFICKRKFKKCKLQARGPPPDLASPPAPHNVRGRHVVDVAVLFQSRPLPSVHRDRDSFVTVHSHDYAEIPDDHNWRCSNMTSLGRSHSMDSLSSISWPGDYLKHIAFPSSDSSFSEYCLQPGASTSVATPTTAISQTPPQGFHNTLPHPVRSALESVTATATATTTGAGK